MPYRQNENALALQPSLFAIIPEKIPHLKDRLGYKDIVQKKRIPPGRSPWPPIKLIQIGIGDKFSQPCL
jgi:hypothetical protein